MSTIVAAPVRPRSPGRILLVLLSITLASAAPARAGAPGCSPTICVGSEVVPIGVAVNVIAIADFNGDGISDLVTLANSNPGNGNIAVLLGNGDGTFQPPLLTAVSNLTRTFVVGFFDAGNDLDVAVGFFGGGGAVYLGNGDGTFQFGAPFATDPSVSALAAGDFDGDGSLDLAAGGGLAILLGNGDGTFQPAVEYPAPDGVVGIATGDFDGNGSLDLALTSGSENTVSVYPGQENGTFGPAIPTVAGLALSQPVAADVDGDGKLDVVVASNGLVAVLIGNGDLTFQAAQDYSTGTYAETAAVADLDGDGFPDLVVSTVADDYSQAPAALSILRNNGDGTFAAGAEYPFYGRPSVAAAADLDGDGKLDVVAGSADAAAAVVLLNLGGGDLASPRIEALEPFALALGDFDGDGFLDVVIGSGTDGIALARGGPDGGYTVAPPAPPQSPNLLVVSIATAADFNGDGRLDVAAVSTQYNHKLAYFAGNGDGTFQAPVTFDIPGPGFLTTGIIAADFNGDGHLDVAISDASSNYASGQITVYVGDGQGGFTNTAAMTVGVGLAAGLAVAHFDGDGFPDIVTGGSAFFDISGSLYFLRGRGDGTFDLPVARTLDERPQALITGEFRTPGVADLVMGSGNTRTVLLPGNGDGTFGDPQTIANFLGIRTGAADFDGDGKLDVVLTDYASEVVVRNLGGGAFGIPSAYPDSAATGALLVGDLEGNGTPDTLISANGFGAVILKSARLGAALVDFSPIAGSRAQWFAHASGFGPLTYQWRKGGVPLSDGGAISGAHTGTLTIDPVSFGDAGAYDVLVTDSCGAAGSNSATLSVEFADVPVSSPFHADILTVATAGITAGCGGGNYCPASPVRRDQMAVFLLKSEHGSAYVPPDCAGTFADVACPGPFTNWVEQLAAEGVTTGCGGGNYCPDSSVTRAQMAVFLLKTSLGSGYAPPAAAGIFNDVPTGAFAADFIEDLYNRAISGGCSASPLLYCPNNPVLRQQMATFLVRTFAP